jgi:hypothetical protein
VPLRRKPRLRRFRLRSVRLRKREQEDKVLDQDVWNGSIFQTKRPLYPRWPLAGVS